MNKLLISLIAIIGLGFLVSCKTKTRRITPENKAAYKQKLVSANKGLVSLDQDKIESYVKRRNWDMKVSETGMWYQVIPSQAGDSAKIGHVAHLKYTVSLLNGNVVYTSDSLGNMAFKIGRGGVESGLEDAILMMKVGDKGRFILPPHLAHGLIGDSNKIPARSAIVYQTELLKLTDY